MVGDLEVGDVVRDRDGGGEERVNTERNGGQKAIKPGRHREGTRVKSSVEAKLPS